MMVQMCASFRYQSVKTQILFLPPEFLPPRLLWKPCHPIQLTLSIWVSKNSSFSKQPHAGGFNDYFCPLELLSPEFPPPGPLPPSLLWKLCHQIQITWAIWVSNNLSSSTQPHVGGLKT